MGVTNERPSERGKPPHRITSQNGFVWARYHRSLGTSCPCPGLACLPRRFRSNPQTLFPYSAAACQERGVCPQRGTRHRHFSDGNLLNRGALVLLRQPLLSQAAEPGPPGPPSPAGRLGPVLSAQRRDLRLSGRIFQWLDEAAAGHCAGLAALTQPLWTLPRQRGGFEST